MIFEQFYLECLSHASYLIGDETTGRAVVVDPQRDVDEYIRTAEAHGLSIERVIETHVHADFVSGHLELAARTGAVISYGDALGHTDFAVDTLADGDRLELGDVVLEIRATPGHTPESISVVIWNGTEDAEPFAVLTGDTLFIGDVGRPDLLASLDSDPDTLARQLYHSLHDQLLSLPDATLVYPAHGAGSACGKQLSTETSSTLGEQRRVNYALQPMTEDEFVATVLEGQSVAPPYFLFNAGRNRAERPLLDEQDTPRSMTIDEVLAAGTDGAALLDTREPTDFARGHVAGAYSIGLAGRFSENAGALVAQDRPIVLVGDPAHRLEAKVRLARIGFDTVIGALDDPAAALESRPDLVEHGSVLTVEQLAESMGRVPDLQIVDVRTPSELIDGTVRGARHIPLAELMRRIGELDPDHPTAILCASGYRAATAAAALAAEGFADVSTVLGGIGAWRGAGLPLAIEGEDPMDITEVGVEEADELVGSSAYLLDVREADEWSAGHAPAANWIPVAEVESRMDELPKDRQILAICRSGGRSAAATETLVGAGRNAANVTGGMEAWARAGLDVVAEDGAAGSII